MIVVGSLLLIEIGLRYNDSQEIKNIRTKMYQDELIEEKNAEEKKESKLNEVEILELSSPEPEPKKHSKKRNKIQKGHLTTKEPDTTELTTSKETSTTTTTSTTNEATTTTTTTTTTTSASTTTTTTTIDDTPASAKSTVTDISPKKELEPGLPESPKRKAGIAAGDWLRARTCQGDENIFFLKTSKTGSQTLMAIMQRFGIRHNSTFLLAENMNGALSQLHTPISQDRDCWVGKHLGMKFNISTQHLKYNRDLINSVMIPGHKKISIIREPTSNFISSYRYYQYMMTSIWLDVGLRTIRDKKNPPTEILYKEMEDFLQSFEHAEKVIRRIPPTSFARLGTYRSQLLYFGYFTDKNGREWHSYDYELPDEIMNEWVRQLENEFDLILIMEHYDISLAVMVLKFCWKIEDVIYLKVNEQTKTSTTLSDKAVKVLEELNRPDYIFYDYMNATLWNTVAELGIEKVEAVAAEIDRRSHQVESECISPSKKTIGSHMKPVLLPEKMNDPDCRAFIAHGPAMTKILQRRMLDVLGDQYQTCPKTVLKDGSWADNMERRKETLRGEYDILASSTSYKDTFR